MTPRVSIVINTCNRAASLRLTLEALELLDYPHFEVVVVNGPSTDETEALLKQWSDRIKIARCVNRNLSESRNIGIALAAGEYVAFIDDDAYPDPGWLDQLIAGFDRDEVAGVGGPVYDHTGCTLQARYNVASKLGDALPDMVFNPTPFYNAPASMWFPYTMGTNSCFRRDRLIEIGGFDEEYDFYLDETDVCCRIVELGYVIRLLGDGFVYHKFLESHIRTSQRAIRDRFSVLKNRVYFALKHGLRAAPFYDVCRNLMQFVDRQRADYQWNVRAGLLTHEDLEKFERDVPQAFDRALERLLTGSDRKRIAAWFMERQTLFLPFRTLRPKDQKLHLCFFTKEWPPMQLNGIARVIYALATGLAVEGHHVHALTIGEGHNRVDLEDRVWVHRIVACPHPLPEGLDVPEHIWNYSASLHEELIRIHNHRPVDLVQAPNWDSEGIAAILDRRFRTVLGLYTPLRTVFATDPRFDPCDPMLSRMTDVEEYCYRHAEGLLGCGISIIEEIESRYKLSLPRERLGLVPHGLSDVASGVELTLQREKVNVLFVGRLEPRKGVDVLLKVIPTLAAEFPELVFTVVGNDRIPNERGTTYREQFERSIFGRALCDRVAFRGVIRDEELWPEYANCDIFVAPSLYESFGLTLIEAMMFGKPVVGCDIGGMREIVENRRNGFLVPPGDAEALRQAIARLAASEELRRQFGLRSRAIYEERFTAKRMMEGVVQYYRRFLALVNSQAHAGAT